MSEILGLFLGYLLMAVGAYWFLRQRVLIPPPKDTVERLTFASLCFSWPVLIVFAVYAKLDERKKRD